MMILVQIEIHDAEQTFAAVFSSHDEGQRGVIGFLNSSELLYGDTKIKTWKQATDQMDQIQATWAFTELSSINSGNFAGVEFSE